MDEITFYHLKMILFFQLVVIANPGKYHFESFDDVEKAFNEFGGDSLSKVLTNKS